MSTSQAEELGRVWGQVKDWPVSLQVSLARRILDVVDAKGVVVPRGKPVAELIGLGAGLGEPPSDETVRQWIDEHRTEKYGS
jgi:hypothetical protein